MSQLKFLDILTVSIRPLVAAAVMATTVLYTTSLIALPVLIEFTIKVVVGAGVYTLTIFLLWTTFGRPNGAEAYVLDKAKSISQNAAATLKRRLGSFAR